MCPSSDHKNPQENTISMLTIDPIEEMSISLLWKIFDNLDNMCNISAKKYKIYMNLKLFNLLNNCGVDTSSLE